MGEELAVWSSKLQRGRRSAQQSDMRHKQRAEDISSKAAVFMLSPSELVIHTTAVLRGFPHVL